MNISTYIRGLVKKTSGEANDDTDYADILDKINEINFPKSPIWATG